MSARNKALLLLAGLSVALTGFALGIAVHIHKSNSTPEVRREQVLRRPGNASPAVRTAVVRTLPTLQRGYAQRDPTKVATLAQDIFPKDGDVLILGTDGGAGEWVRGTSSARQFIENDWRSWGDLRFDADQAIVWCSGDTAWLATIGSVHWEKSNRPLRFTAILTREEDRWVFRQMHFQWDDNQAALGDLLNRRNSAGLLIDALR